jgi:hypothetical protein
MLNMNRMTLVSFEEIYTALQNLKKEKTPVSNRRPQGQP